ncbi:hypothetical protein C5E26_07745 [Pectobacterium parmentieri]|uniref:hypothetical protein n=1 Tax=Pectobacterium parmentieri TaxID=1905730 RepID=UPI000EB49BAD|nr:hypothetical protein [Pectobacterium parmentieri]AYH00839.1 hypothetical protein C5E26_07745 [Pectobacterium parmentieri]
MKIIKSIQHDNNTLNLVYENYDEYGFEYAVILDKEVTDWRGMSIKSFNAFADTDEALAMRDGTLSAEFIANSMISQYKNLFIKKDAADYDFDI